MPAQPPLHGAQQQRVAVADVPPPAAPVVPIEAAPPPVVQTCAFGDDCVLPHLPVGRHKCPNCEKGLHVPCAMQLNPDLECDDTSRVYCSAECKHAYTTKKHAATAPDPCAMGGKCACNGTLCDSSCIICYGPLHKVCAPLGFCSQVCYAKFNSGQGNVALGDTYMQNVQNDDAREAAQQAEEARVSALKSANAAQMATLEAEFNRKTKENKAERDRVRGKERNASGKLLREYEKLQWATCPRQPRRKSEVLPLEFSRDEKATAKTREYAKMMQCEQFEKIGLLPHFSKTSNDFFSGSCNCAEDNCMEFAWSYSYKKEHWTLTKWGGRKCVGQPTKKESDYGSTAYDMDMLLSCCDSLELDKIDAKNCKSHLTSYLYDCSLVSNMWMSRYVKQVRDKRMGGNIEKCIAELPMYVAALNVLGWQAELVIEPANVLQPQYVALAR